ncbi:preprotein translocase subunit SecD [Methanobrevibacter filiformis]|uniref:Protein-export membrane protein SecD n=1 Tax=Methanobrevibacter filiformis TaxID=55758 RepID=A0A166A7Y9_9EURY|nr:preprotein translocase subunit SecD [Methanobrevibacter filiformis]KZX11692.1 protein translocase subunit SecD [Methanobrevibacter filiformis]
MSKRRKKGGLSEFIRDKQVILLIVVVIAAIASISVLGLDQGLDLKGGSLIQLQLEKPVDKATMDVVTAVIDKRLNIYGVQDVKVRSSGDQLVVVEMAGVTPSEVEKLIGNPGKFEAKINNETVLTGVSVASVDTAEITDTSWQVPFKLTTQGAKDFAKAVEGKANEKVYMYLDGKLIDNNPPSLAPELASGEPTTDLSVSGGGDSYDEAKNQSQQVYTVLKTGSLPVKIKVIGASTVSAELGQEFLKGALIAGIAALIIISLVVFIRYKKPILVIPIVITSVSEVLVVMGIASVINWNIDLSAIVGLIASLGTGVDDQIIITDEVLDDKKEGKRRRIRTKMSVKNALFIVFASAGTLIAAMLPLAYVGFARGSSGIGTLAGFAFTTIIGVLVGVFITRPVYAKFVELFIK